MKIQLTQDARLWWKKWSTWLATLALMLDGAAAAFMMGPPEWRASFPPGLGVYLLMAGMGVKFLIPLATSVCQGNLQKDT